MNKHLLCCIGEETLCGKEQEDTPYPSFCNRCLSLEARNNYCPKVPHDCNGQRNGLYSTARMFEIGYSDGLQGREKQTTNEDYLGGYMIAKQDLSEERNG